MGLMPIHAGPKPWAHRVLSFVRASGCRASIVPPVLPLGVSMSMTNTVDRWGWVRTAYWQRVSWAIGPVVLWAGLAGVGVFDPGVFEVAVSAGVQGFAVKVTDEGLGIEFVPAG